MNNPVIGFIGLGLMGSAMVERLLSKGYALQILANRSRAPVEKAVGLGAREADTAKTLAQACDIVMLCVDTSASVESRMLGEQGVIAGLKPGAVVIDFGTSLPASTKMLGEKVAKKNATYLDAPLGRTPSHARVGKLNIMAAGDREAFEKVEPVLQDLGENIFHLGALGNGHTLKLINNFFGMTTAAAMSEAFVMADKAGLDRQQLYDVMSAGPLHSGMMDFIKHYAIDGKRDSLAFSMFNGAKDLAYYRDMAESAGLGSSLSVGTSELLEDAKSSGFAELYVTQMVDFLSKK